jgi:probable metal-binding protein
MQMMLQTGKVYSRETLLSDILSHFGPEARFYTCSSQGLTPQEIINFLEARGKFTSVADGFQMSPDRICQR